MLNGVDYILNFAIPVFEYHKMVKIFNFAAKIATLMSLLSVCIQFKGEMANQFNAIAIPIYPFILHSK